MENSIEEVKEIFQVISSSENSNSIDFINVGVALRVLGLNPTDSEVLKFTNGFANQTSISLDDFYSYYLSMESKHTPTNSSQLKDILNIWDNEKNGYVSVSNFRSVLNKLGDKMALSDISTLFSHFEDVNGNIKVEDLANALSDSH